jgi:hypothetical protein
MCVCVCVYVYVYVYVYVCVIVVKCVKQRLRVHELSIFWPFMM